MIDLSGQPCPICGATTSTLVHETIYPEIHYPGKFILRRCNGCGLLFNSPRLDNDELSQLYGKNYYFFNRKDSAEFNRIVAMYQRTIAMIPGEVLPKKLIDIGSGRGYFPAVLKGLGWDAQGIEISANAVQYARSKFDLPIFTGTVEQYAASPQAQQFPLVTGIDVIEHVPDPAAFIAAAVKIVAPGGRLILDTPNAHADNIRRKGVVWKGFNPFHIYLFSIRNLSALLAKHGMIVEKSFSYGNMTEGRAVRDVAIQSLRSIGLLRPMVSTYFGLKKLAGSSSGDANALVARAVQRLKTEPSYASSFDSSAALAGKAVGDNIVIIARKMSAQSLAGVAVA